MANMQKLSIRLLLEGKQPEEVIRNGIELKDWQNIENSKIALGTLGGEPPKWANFLNLQDDNIYNTSAFSLLFINISDRWFVISFGLGHVKLDLDSCEHDFGLRVVLNSVDPNLLKSTDIRTPDENTLSKRSQASRGSDQTAFSIDVERDLLRGISGKPKDEYKEFAYYVAGSDGLTIHREMEYTDLIEICQKAYTIYQKDDYKKHFSWVDQIRHIRNDQLIEQLNKKLIDEITSLLQDDRESNNIYLAFPVIYDPEKTSYIRYKGFSNRNLYSDLDINNYIGALKEKDIKTYTIDNFKNHIVHEVDDTGADCGGRWKVYNCFIFETELDSTKYILSCGNWYQIDKTLSEEINDFFNRTTQIDLPEPKENENEENYNLRIKDEEKEQLICLDQKFIKPSGSTTPIEACDFLSKDKFFIHIKNKNSSSRLSHLFNQGTVSARILAIDSSARDELLKRINEVQSETGQSDFNLIIPSSKNDFNRAEFTVVYGVIVSSKDPKLPFFSLISFRQAAKELEALGYNYAFSWIKKPIPAISKSLKRKTKSKL